MNPEDARTARAATVRGAIELIDTTNTDELLEWLRVIGIYDRLKTNPTVVREILTASLEPSAIPGARFGAWKAAQQLLQAAGRPYMPADYLTDPTHTQWVCMTVVEQDGHHVSEMEVRIDVPTTVDTAATIQQWLEEHRADWSTDPQAVIRSIDSFETI